MKTFLITVAAAALLATSATAATTVSVNQGYQFNHDGVDATFYSGSVATRLPESPISVDIFLKDSVPLGATLRSGSKQRIEVGASSQVVGPTYFRVAVGEAVHDYPYHFIRKSGKFVLTPTAVDHQYYSLTAGLKVPLTQKVTLGLSEKYENTFVNTNQFETWTSGASVSYALTKNIALKSSYEYIAGNTRSDALSVGAALSF